MSRERISENPFYVLGLPPDCSRADLEREGQKLLAMLELGITAAKSYPTPLGPTPRTADSVRQAMAELRDPRRRLMHELWAQLPASPAPTPTPSAAAGPAAPSAAAGSAAPSAAAGSAAPYAAAGSAAPYAAAGSAAPSAAAGSAAPYAAAGSAAPFGPAGSAAPFEPAVGAPPPWPDALGTLGFGVRR